MKKHAKQGLCFRSAMLSVAFLLMSLISFSASAYDFEIDGIGYDIKSAEEHTVLVASLSNVPAGTDCVIPESVTWQDTQYSVVEISLIEIDRNFHCKTLSIPASVISIGRWNWFSPNLTAIMVDKQNPVYCSVDGVLYSKDMTQILRYPAGKPDTTYSIATTVTAVGNDAFLNCNNLQEIILPPAVETIGWYSFTGCYRLISMDFPDSVTSIGGRAMSCCDNLQSVSIGKSVSKIGENLFARSSSLKEINVDVENKNFCSIEGVLYRILEDSGLELISYPLGKDAKSYSFPDRITAIGCNAFEGCRTLPANLVLPNTVKSIKQQAFWSTSSLKSIKLPASVSIIESQAFILSEDFSEIIVDFENPEYSSMDGVLYNKNQTSLLLCPENYPATEFDITEGVSEIGEDAFCRCSKIEKINIPESVTKIGWGAFSGCTSLKSIIIPNSVEILREEILRYCENLQTVTIGRSVRLIEEYTFTYDTSINTITCLPTVPPMISGSRQFENEVYQTATLYVPYGCKEAYSAAEMWSNFQNIVEMEPVGISDINAADGEVSIGVENGAIVVSGAGDGATVEVYTADGRCLYRGNGTEIAGLAQGLYIVRVGSAVSKVVL